MNGRRQSLDQFAPSATAATHAGLWLEQGIARLKETGAPQEHLVDLCESVRVPAGYPRFYERWKRSVQALPPCTRLAEAEVRGRLVVGLGAESVLETSITLHRTYGVPYLPGSALKGLAAAAAHRHLAADDWRKPGPGREIGTSHRLLFGDLGEAGWVTFHDALWVPAGDRLPLDLDVMTVHHPLYYRGEAAPPADWDSPTPVSFLTARGCFLLALTGPKTWVGAALDILTAALDQDGLGAKTAAGYGRMTVKPITFPASESSGQAPASMASGAWEKRVAGIQPGNAIHEVPRLLRDFSGDERRDAARRLLRDLKDFFRKRAELDWVRELRAAAELETP